MAALIGLLATVVSWTAHRFVPGAEGAEITGCVLANQATKAVDLSHFPAALSTGSSRGPAGEPQVAVFRRRAVVSIPSCCNSPWPSSRTRASSNACLGRRNRIEVQVSVSDVDRFFIIQAVSLAVSPSSSPRPFLHLHAQ
ncbi:hypothetical protein B0T10DRAFT_321354 [Thelonectria olida]|uniref:Uncharacterized protein n=1 Tax=Thelonectria olida TaxID=1576542 RepID=A0A9P9AQ09_9HYPO|nr:hypothetical protein B0T10DRAFT_321354 [Thelonectria olida]